MPGEPEKADIILVTHEHFDHFDTDKISKIRKHDTKFFGPAGVIKKAGFGWGGNYKRKDGMHFTIAGFDMPKGERD